MKSILCFGDSNVRGFIPGSFDELTYLGQRYPKSMRWTSLLQENLGQHYHVIEEGLNGRTSAYHEIVPGRPYRNGVDYLPYCLESHYPVDLVILMIGTNDVQIQFDIRIEDLDKGIRQLVNIVKTSKMGPNQIPPNVLLIAPPHVLDIPTLTSQYNHTSIMKSQKLGSAYQKIAEDENCAFLDAQDIVTASEVDGLHLDDSQCSLFANELTIRIRALFGQGGLYS